MGTLILFAEVVVLAIAFWQVNAVAGMSEMKGYSKTAMPKLIRIFGNTAILVPVIWYLLKGLITNALASFIILLIVAIVAAICSIVFAVLFFITVYNKDLTYKNSKKSIKVDLTLCIFLGWVGAHRYYEGKYVTAVIWTLTGGVFGIGYLVDFLSMLNGVRMDSKSYIIRRWNSSESIEAYVSTLSEADKDLYNEINYERKPGADKAEAAKGKFTIKDLFSPSMLVYICFFVFFIVVGLLLYK